MKKMFGTLKVVLGIAVIAGFITAFVVPLTYCGGVGNTHAAADPPGQEPIVGFWKTTFTAEGNGSQGPPDGTVIDWGFQQWHSDGTEIHNTAVRPPASGDFCLGTWEIAGPLQYKLNHFSTAWTPDGSAFLGVANIHESITVSHDHNSFTGTFTIDQYNTGGNLLAHITGNVQGTRITGITTINDVL